MGGCKIKTTRSEPFALVNQSGIYPCLMMLIIIIVSLVFLFFSSIDRSILHANLVFFVRRTSFVNVCMNFMPGHLQNDCA